MAKKFQFRLQQILKLRKEIEDIRVRELSYAKGKLLQLEDKLKEHYESEEGFLETYSEFEKKHFFDSNQVIAYCEYREWLIRREKEYRSLEKQWTLEVDNRRKVAVKASRERKLLENLKEKKLLANTNEVLGEEQRFLDEISAIAFIRRDRVEKYRDSVLAGPF